MPQLDAGDHPQREHVLGERIPRFVGASRELAIHLAHTPLVGPARAGDLEPIEKGRPAERVQRRDDLAGKIRLGRAIIH
jgi:hypothetical protein